MTVYEQNVQRATRAELWEPGEEVRLVCSPAHTFVVRATGGAPAPSAQTESPAPVPAETERSPAGWPDAHGGDRGDHDRARADCTDRHISRRRLLQGTALAGIGAFHRRLPGLRQRRRPSAAESTSPTAAASGSRGAVRLRRRERAARRQPQVRQLDRYIDLTVDPGRTASRERRRRQLVPTLERFTKETGIKVDYNEAIDGNEKFFDGRAPGPLSRACRPSGISSS